MKPQGRTTDAANLAGISCNLAGMNITEIKQDVKSWQRLLRAAGYYSGAIDGIRGPKQRAAETAWESASLGIAQMYGTFDSRSEENILTLLPSAQKVARVWLRDVQEMAAGLGVSVKIICGTRSYAEQDRLYRQRPKVTNAKGGYSWHNFGLAWDFGVFSVDGRSYYGEHEHYKTFGRVASAIEGAEWGGEWASFKDEPHIQLALYKSVSDARKNFERR